MTSEAPSTMWPNAASGQANATNAAGGSNFSQGASGTGNGGPPASAAAYQDLSRLLEQNLQNDGAMRGSASSGSGGLDPSWLLGNNTGASNYDASSFLSNLQEQELRQRSNASAAANYQNLLMQSTRSAAGSNLNGNGGANDAMAALEARGGGGGGTNGANGTGRPLEREILDDFYKILQNAEQNQGANGNGGGPQANVNDGARLNNMGNTNLSDFGQNRFDGNNFSFPFNQQQQLQQLQQQQQQQRSLDNFDLAAFANQRQGGAGGSSNLNNINPSDAAVWLALQRQQQQQQQQLQFQQQLNSMQSNNGFPDLASMLPNRFGGGMSGSAYSMLGNSGMGGGMLNNNMAFGGSSGSDSQQSTLLAALLAEPMTQLDVSHGSGGSGPLFNHSASANGMGSAGMSQDRKPPPVAHPDAFAAMAPASVTAAAQAAARPTLPFRALSAYNFFFRDERDRIINGGEHEFTPTKKQKLLSEHWFRDRSVKRRHRKTHGKIAFTTLSKVISQGWRDLPEEKKAFYREVAAEDLDRYQRELDQYKLVDAANLTTNTTAALFGTSASAAQSQESLDESQLSAAQKQLNRAMAA